MAKKMLSRLGQFVLVIFAVSFFSFSLVSGSRRRSGDPDQCSGRRSQQGSGGGDARADGTQRSVPGAVRTLDEERPSQGFGYLL